MIFSLLGTPNKEDVSFVTDDKALRYLSSYQKRDRVDFKERFKGVSKEAIDFLERIL